MIKYYKYAILLPLYIPDCDDNGLPHKFSHVSHVFLMQYFFLG